ncbi:hypothetical protein LSTR_LSTR011099, partial [Laodelphax striatellus]
RVMAFVQKAVARLDEPEKLDSLLRELGRKHFTYGAKHKYIDEYDTSIHSDHRIK